MINIAITAGGTIEDIDGVRKITNTSTGKLGWACLKAAISYLTKHSISDFRIYYIHTPTAYKEELGKAELRHIDFISVTDALSVYDAVDNLTQTINISHFIHAMAISDFTFSYALSMENMANEIANLIATDKNKAFEDILHLIRHPKSGALKNEKISSSEDLLMGLKVTRKIIPIIKKNNPHTVLLGFKLLRNVSEKELIANAISLANKNGCDFVFANDLCNVSASTHSGILIHEGRVIGRPDNKEQIAEMIISVMLGFTSIK